jgi:uncharacterized membrane protein YeaQ/YmgE (transglycosylase-associated protein family)
VRGRVLRTQSNLESGALRRVTAIVAGAVVFVIAWLLLGRLVGFITNYVEGENATPGSGWALLWAAAGAVSAVLSGGCAEYLDRNFNRVGLAVSAMAAVIVIAFINLELLGGIGTNGVNLVWIAGAVVGTGVGLWYTLK